MSSPLKQNTTTIQELLNTINSLPEAGDVELPELSNPASAEEVFLNKEFIDEDGNSVTGTFSIDNELSNQDNLISQIQTALQNKATATGEDVTSETIAYTTKLATLETAISALETELQGKASGGSGGGSVGWINVTSLPSTYIAEPDLVSIYYYEAPENCIGAACIGAGDANAKHGGVIIACTKNSGSFNTVKSVSYALLKLSDADGTGTIVKIET